VYDKVNEETSKGLVDVYQLFRKVIQKRNQSILIMLKAPIKSIFIKLIQLKEHHFTLQKEDIN